MHGGVLEAVALVPQEFVLCQWSRVSSPEDLGVSRWHPTRSAMEKTTPKKEQQVISSMCRDGRAPSRVSQRPASNLHVERSRGTKRDQALLDRGIRFELEGHPLRDARQEKLALDQ